MHFFYSKIVVLLLLIFLSGHANAQSWKEKLKKKAEKALSTDDAQDKLTTEEIVKGLKEALKQGAIKAQDKASKVDGFYKNKELFISFPEEAKKVKVNAQKVGLNKKVEKFEQTLNRAAEEASKKSSEIFIDAIMSMNISEAKNILNGDSVAATNYLRSNTYDKLYRTFLPIIKEATDKVELTKYWNPLVSAYNKTLILSGGEKVETDLNDYVCKKTIKGIFILIAKEEVEIRSNPIARVTDILKKVFGE